MTLEELGTAIEQADDEEIIYCYVDRGQLVATFSTRKDIEVNVLTPYEMRLLDKDEYTPDDIISKVFELKQIANFKTE